MDSHLFLQENLETQNFEYFENFKSWYFKILNLL